MDHPTPARPIRFPFDERKATAAAGLLLELAGGSMEYLRLLKLLYFADRESFDTLGRPISGDRYVNMRHGPVLSQVYNLVKQRVHAATPPESIWGRYIEGDGRFGVRLTTLPDSGALSEAEIGILMSVFQRYRDRDTWSLRDATHELPEWEDPGDTSRDIAVEEILRVLGKSDAEVEDIRERAAEQAHFGRLFGA